MRKVTHENTFTRGWYGTFLAPIPEETTAREVAFLARNLPRDRFPTVLDVCCGEGRHAIGLTRLGYRVRAIDSNLGAIQRGRATGGAEVDFVAGDMRAPPLDTPHHAVICMWQSFGFDSADGNEKTMHAMCSALSTRGRLIIDLYQLVAARRLPERAREIRNGVEVHTVRQWDGQRLTVDVSYSNGMPPDRFDWHIYGRDELAAMMTRCGLQLVTECCWWDETRPPTEDDVRVQYVFESVAGGDR